MENTIHLKISTDFSEDPGPRKINEGSSSGEEFRIKLLEPLFEKAVNSNGMLEVDIDDTSDYPPSFIDESFGTLARENGVNKVKKHLKIKTSSWFTKEAEIWLFIENCKNPRSKIYRET